MKRLRRILFNSLTAISLLLAIVTAGLWVRSGFRLERCVFQKPSSQSTTVWASVHGHGSLSFLKTVYMSDDPPRIAQVVPSNGFRRDPAYGSLRSRLLPSGMGVEYAHHARRQLGVPSQTAVITVRHWFLLLIFASLPAVRIGLARQRRHPSHRGYCPACGYDMRANPERCSECGWIVAKTTRTTDESNLV
jgi:hypothetical protein